jgi:hypothetical protein
MYCNVLQSGVLDRVELYEAAHGHSQRAEKHSTAVYSLLRSR